jgi:hypothetical protein
MKFYVQYDTNGYITGTVYSDTAPDHPCQLDFDTSVNTIFKKVVNKTLVDALELVDAK